jgi:hypothetical protein
MDLKLFVENAAILIPAIIFVTWVVTNYVDPKNRWERFYPLLPILFGSVASFILASPLTWQTVAIGVFVYGLGAGQAYKLGKTTILGQ